MLPSIGTPTVIELNAEIHFHEQEKASVFLESNCSGDQERFGQIAVFVFFALRMPAISMSVSHPTVLLA
jgi:hypothetical protein